MSIHSSFNYTETIPLTDLVPAIPLNAQLSITVVFTALYSIIFVACYIQLWLLLCLGYTRRRHPFSLLWLALGWTSLRILLFSFYWPFVGFPTKVGNSPLVSDASAIPSALAYFLYAFPSCIQFYMLCVVASFSVGISSREFVTPVKTARQLRIFLAIFAGLFSIASMMAALIQSLFYGSSGNPLWLTSTRVLIQDGLFIFVSSFLILFLRRVVKLPHVSLILESLNTGRCGLLFTGCFLVFAFTTRAIYDITALGLRSVPSFNFGWIDLSDHAEISTIIGPNASYAVFAVVLLLWDFLPTAVVLFLFRLRRPQLIRTPGPSPGVVLFWGADNYESSAWEVPVNVLSDDHEALLSGFDDGTIESFSAGESFFGNNNYNGVKFGVGSA